MGVLEGEFFGNGCKLFNCFFVFFRFCWDEVFFKVLDLIMIGLCFGVFLLLIVLFFVGILFFVGLVIVIDIVFWFVLVVFIVFVGLVCFFLNNDLNSFFF